MYRNARARKPPSNEDSEGSLVLSDDEHSERSERSERSEHSERSEDCSQKGSECSHKSGDSFSDVYEALAQVESSKCLTKEAPGGETVPKPKALVKLGYPPKAPFARRARR